MKIAIIGAGIGGLAAAYDLARPAELVSMRGAPANQVTIFEAADYVGGLASGFKEPSWDWSVERYYHHWFQSDRDLLGLMDELGWRDKVHWIRPYTVMYHRGRFYPFDSIFSALLFPGLGWGIHKVRFGLVGLYLRLLNDWHNLEKVTAETWMLRYAGTRVYRTMWQPLLEGKFGPYYRQVNMAWLWARLKARTTRLGTFEGGFQAFADALAGRLRSMGVSIQLATPVKRIMTQRQAGTSDRAPAQGALLLETPQGVQAFDQCLVTTSPVALAHLAPELPSEITRDLLELKSLGAVVMVLALKQRLSEEGYYWFNLPKSAGFPFLALVEHTNFVSPDHFGGDHIVYLGDYVEAASLGTDGTRLEHEYFRLSQDELLQRFLPTLTRFNPAFAPGWVRNAWLFRTSYAQPVPLVNHSRRIPPIKMPLPGLYLASMSQVYPWDRGTNFAIQIGRQAARMMLEGRE